MATTNQKLVSDFNNTYLIITMQVMDNKKEKLIEFYINGQHK